MTFNHLTMDVKLTESLGKLRIVLNMYLNYKVLHFHELSFLHVHQGSSFKLLAMMGLIGNPLENVVVT